MKRKAKYFYKNLAKPEEKKIIKLDRAKDRVTMEDLKFGSIKKKKVLDMRDDDEFKMNHVPTSDNIINNTVYEPRFKEQNVNTKEVNKNCSNYNIMKQRCRRPTGI